MPATLAKLFRSHPTLNKTSLAHYEIVGLLGKGGMGEVYRARDTKLDRDVALKVLPDDFAEDAERLARFEREAKTIAGLSHPHIVTLHSVDEADGVHFLTMELIDGESLDQLLQGKALPIDRVLEIGAAVADALAAAHQRGIVHRDLKPANVMIGSDGRAKVLDFGLAKLDMQDAPTRVQSGDEASGRAAEPAALTTDGTVMGTPQYMSPEQVRGEAVDHRSDLFALGALLYELAGGKRAFGGSSVADITSAVLRDAPTSLLELKPDLPRGLIQLIDRCLEKDRDRRAGSARQIANQLTALHDELRFASSGSGAPTRVLHAETGGHKAAPAAGSRRGMIAAAVAVLALGAGAVWWMTRDAAPDASAASQDLAAAQDSATDAIDEKSIAVLPFANLSADPDQEYFSAGISEELLNTLARVPDLLVTARTSTLASVEQGGSVAEIAQRLGVAHVLEGSVRRAGDRVRITAQLIHAADGFQKWSQTWDRTLHDIFAIQDEIARDTLEQLESTLLGSAPTTQSTDPEAYALYLQARQISTEYTPEALQRANELLARVLEIDPGYLPARLKRANTFLDSDLLGAEATAKARIELEFARAQAPGDPAVQASLANLELLEGTTPIREVAAKMQASLDRAPTDPQVLSKAGSLLLTLGRLGEAMKVWEWLAQRDPLNPFPRITIAISHYWAGRSSDCIESARLAQQLGLSGMVHAMIANCQLQLGEADAALESVKAEPDEFWRQSTLPLVLHDLRREEEAEKALMDLIAAHGKSSPYQVACAHAYLGRVDSAFDWLDKSVGPNNGRSEILAESQFANLHDDPRWIPFLRRLGLAPEQVDSIEFSVDLPER